VGKSSIAALVGLALARKYKVCLVDLDLFAPGLHHLLRWPIEDRPTILDFLVGTREGPNQAPDPTQAPEPKEVCHRVEPAPPGWDAKELYLIPGRPSLEQAQWVQGYVLADLRCDLVKERLQWLLTEVQSAFGIEVFVLDLPPSLFGISRAARSLVEEQPGLLAYVSTPIKQDLAGTRDMLSGVREEKSKGRGQPAKAAGSHPRPAQAFLLNRYEGLGHPKNVAAAICDEIAKAVRGPEPSRLDRDKPSRLDRESIALWLKHYEPGLLPQNAYIAGMSKLPPEGNDPPKADILKILGELAERLMARLTAVKPI